MERRIKEKAVRRIKMQELDKKEQKVELLQEEIIKLQKALEVVMEESHNLRRENEKLILQHEESSQKAMQLSEELMRHKSKQRKLKQQIDFSNRRFEKMQNKYNVLANSKLGRLTVSYWEWR